MTVSRFLTSGLTILFLLLDLWAVSAHNIYSTSFKGAQISVKLFGFLAFLTFTVAVITDFLDGYLSRKWNCVSSFGKVFDPLADKFLIIGTMVILMISKKLWIPLGALLIARDLIMDTIRLILYKQNKVVAAIKSAKLKTIFQMLGLMIFLALFNGQGEAVGWFSATFWISHVLLFISLIFSIFSFIVYMRKIKNG